MSGPARRLRTHPGARGESEIIGTDPRIGQDNIAHSRKLEFDIHHVVFTVSARGIVAFTFSPMACQTTLEPVFLGMRDWLTGDLDWFFPPSGNIFVLPCLFLITSPLGKVRLGVPEAARSHGYVGWFSMLFAAGMGIGPMFCGLPEPMSHFSAAIGGISAGADGFRADWPPWQRRGRCRRGEPTRHGRHDLPMGPAPLGDLRRVSRVLYPARKPHSARTILPGAGQRNIKRLHKDHPLLIWRKAERA